MNCPAGSRWSTGTLSNLTPEGSGWRQCQVSHTGIFVALECVLAGDSGATWPAICLCREYTFSEERPLELASDHHAVGFADVRYAAPVPK